MALRGRTSAIRVYGLDRALAQLNRAVKKVRFRTKQGMIKVGLFIQGESQKIVPVDLANLKASAFTVWGGGGRTTASFKGKEAGQLSSEHDRAVSEEKGRMPAGLLSEISPQVSVGYSAFYAIYVHEDLEAKHEVGGPKYLENAVRRNMPQIIALIKGEVK